FAIAAYQLPIASGAALPIATGVMQGTGGGAAILAGSVACQRHLGPANANFREAGTLGLRIVAQALVELARDFNCRRDTSPAFHHLSFCRPHMSPTMPFSFSIPLIPADFPQPPR